MTKNDTGTGGGGGLFDRLLEVEGETSAEGFKLSQPSAAPTAKYECVSCGHVRTGYRTVAVRYGTKLGLCVFCASDEEERAGRRLPPASALHRNRPPRPKREAREAAEAAERTVLTCPQCGQPAPGGLLVNPVDHKKRLCATCFDRLAQAAFEALKKKPGFEME